jgi:uncharacterized protein
MNVMADSSEADHVGPGQLDIVHMQWGIRIPLRDGNELSGVLFRPRDQASGSPTIVCITPYGADIGHSRGVYFASQGFSFLTVDCRGRGNSSGSFRPYVQEATDGYDVVEWAARQAFSDGRVVMLGASYSGYNQWTTASKRPPSLRTIIPTAAPFIGIDFPMRRNIFYPFVIKWLAFVSGRGEQTRLFYDHAFWSSRFALWKNSGRPFRDLPEICGVDSAIFREWIGHPMLDAYWDAYNPTSTEYAAIDIPILTITGIYDDDQPGALEHYRRHLEAHPAAYHYLVVGPWDHQSTNTAKQAFGGMTFGEDSLVDLPRLRLDWFRWILGEGPRPEFLSAAVVYYVTGRECWRRSESLAAITERTLSLYLDSQGGANDPYQSGRLCEHHSPGGCDVFRYQPYSPESSEVETERNATGAEIAGSSLIECSGRRQLIYHSEPFQEAVEISGFFRAELWLSISTPDTDIFAAVYEVLGSGDVIRLTNDAIRARHREDPRSCKLIDSREALPFCLDQFHFTSRVVRKGSRLRLTIAPVGRLIEGNFVQTNFNGGGVVAEESCADARELKLTLRHDACHPSALHVPIAKKS